MNIQKYYDADGNATHYVCRVLLSFHNAAMPWIERVRQATLTNVALVKSIEVQYMSCVHRANGTGEASVWLMIPANREVSSVLHTISDFSNRLGIYGITAAVAIFDLNYLTSKKIDQ
jgi:hypothetical protein